jgi:hypothetical protein
MRRIVEWTSLALVAMWGSWFATLYWWSYHRPHAPSAALGLNYYVKTPMTVVYVGTLENDINSAFQFAVLVLTPLLIGGVAWLQFLRHREARTDAT